jgi:hypothetical protein
MTSEWKDVGVNLKDTLTGGFGIMVLQALLVATLGERVTYRG